MSDLKIRNLKRVVYKDVKEPGLFGMTYNQNIGEENILQYFDTKEGWKAFDTEYEYIYPKAK